MSNLFVLPRAEVQTSSGGVGAGYKLEFFQSGTSTNLDTYSDDSLTTANANPVVADSAGRFGAIFLKDEDYKVVLSDADDVQIWSADPVRGGVDNLADDTLRSTLDSGGSSNAYTLTVNRTFSAYANGQMFVFKASFQNTDSATLNVTPAGGSALGAKTLKKFHDKDLASGDIENGQWVIVKYDGTNFQVLSPLATTADVPGRNVLINGDMRIWQRGTSFDSTTTPANSDDTYLADRWILLSDGNDAVDVSQETLAVPTGSYAAMKLDVETANKKFGILQVLEARDSAELIGGVVSLSFKARRTGTTIDNLRAAVLAWDSTADSVTSDVVSSWESAGTNPTLATNWTFENTPTSLATLTTSFQTFTIEGISIDTSSTANVAVFIWVDDTTIDVGDFLYITDVQLELSPTASAFQRRSTEDELCLCQRYYEQTYNQGVEAGTSTEAGAVRLVDPVAAGGVSVHFKTVKRTAPTVTGYSTTGASGKYRDLTSSADFDITLEDIGDSGCHASFATSGAADEAKGFHWTADAEL